MHMQIDIHHIKLKYQTSRLQICIMLKTLSWEAAVPGAKLLQATFLSIVSPY